jgi:amino acid permease
MSRAGLNAMRAPMVTLVCSTSAITRDKFSSTLQIVVVAVVAVAMFGVLEKNRKKIQRIGNSKIQKKKKKSTFSAALHPLHYE